MKLKILNVTALDFGTYKCMAKNSQGDSNSDITLYGKKIRSLRMAIPLFYIYYEPNAPHIFQIPAFLMTTD